MRPLRRIFSISDADLQTIDILLYGTHRLRRYGFHRLVAVHFHHTALGLVILQHRKCLPLIGFQPFGNNFLGVVRTHDKSPAVDITDAFNFGGLKIDVINPSAGGTRTTPGNSLQWSIITYCDELPGVVLVPPADGFITSIFSPPKLKASVMSTAGDLSCVRTTPRKLLPNG